MKTDKEIKKEFRIECSENPDSYYPTAKLNALGFQRKKCDTCQKYFWSIDSERTVCGDPDCSGGFDLAEGTPCKIELTYIEVWKKFQEIFNPLGYTSVNRYPVVARWNPTCDYVMASIAAFQPYVVTGEVDPPAKKLVIPQFCLRFGDVDNVGITGSHCTGFVMIGQHAFLNEDEWNQEQLFMDIYSFLIDGIGLDKKELIVHEDAWAGGGSFGPCMEFFSRGVELFNQVYTMFIQTPKGRESLKLKVLDMGLGMERVAWFSQATPNVYEATFPYVLEKIREKTHVEIDHELYKKFSKYSAYLNADEVEDLSVAWKNVAEKLNLDVETLKKKIWPNVAIYSIAEHTRALLVALVDGALPSNTGGGYNLRIIFRRAFSFIDEFGWDIDLYEVMKSHATELKELFPELEKGVSQIKGIVENEKIRFDNSKQKAKQIVSKLLEKNEITEDDFLKLYDSNGVSPELIVNAAKEKGKVFSAPDNFYAKVSELHEKQEQIHSTHKENKFDLENVPETEILYFKDYSVLEFDAKILKIIDDKFVILDKTYFYPTSGGQVHDVGKLGDFEIVDVFKQENRIIHVIPEHNLSVGDLVHGVIDKDIRLQLTQHHTATHVINAAARRVLGHHINQAGAKKTPLKAHIDLTHYKIITDDELALIEKEANKIIAEHIDINSFFMPKHDAELKFGMGLYQGGAIPGNSLRIVEIPCVDVEACGGTHLNNTKELVEIKILKSTKIQDGIVRIEFVAGNRAKEEESDASAELEKIASALGVSINCIPSTVEKLFAVWKKVKKAKKKNKLLTDEEINFVSTETFDGDILKDASEKLKTQPIYLLQTVNKFLADINSYKISLQEKSE